MKSKIKRVVATIAILTIIAIPIHTKQVQAPAPEEPSSSTPPIEEAKTKEDYERQLEAIAKAKNLPENKVQEIKETIGGVKGTGCPNGESTWNPEAVGDGGKSHGLVQIHLPAHPHITEAEAKDPDFALNFIVDKFLEGRESLWTCWRATRIM